MLYSRLFNWVVGRINSAMDPTIMAQYSRKKELTLGVLDIYGFGAFAGDRALTIVCLTYHPYCRPCYSAHTRPNMLMLPQK